QTVCRPKRCCNQGWATRPSRYSLLSARVAPTRQASRASRKSSKPARMKAPAATITIVIGNEGAGIDPALGVLAHRRVAIPLVGPAESLNAAVTAGILLYEVISGA
ncbi:MAG: hypothetical protein E4H37_04170, partial [Gemmatimonadales bacterium]